MPLVDIVVLIKWDAEAVACGCIDGEADTAASEIKVAAAHAIIQSPIREYFFVEGNGGLERKTLVAKGA